MHQVAAAIEALEESKPNVHGARKQLKRAADDLYRREKRCRPRRRALVPGED
ncbi:MAG TPA: hypothetical protein VJS12_00885 [Steroidobacteraceae bacterium]|nr:hypothetical protein [Steroidobacteraceae bacterium]